MPESKTYRIGEVSKMLQLKSYVLRFWESEFPQLKPRRTEKGQRLYTEQDVALLRTIRNLLHERGLTIDGARKELAAKTPSSPLLLEIKEELQGMRELLRRDQDCAP
jgi:DNA-binding transcriptional MerR regulator